MRCLLITKFLSANVYTRSQILYTVLSCLNVKQWKVGVGSPPFTPHVTR